MLLLLLRVSGTEILNQLSPKGWTIVGVCLSLVAVENLSFLVPRVMGLMRRPPAALVHLQAGVGLPVDQ